jgi:hypothetical protein
MLRNEPILVLAKCRFDFRIYRHRTYVFRQHKLPSWLNVENQFNERWNFMSLSPIEFWHLKGYVMICYVKTTNEISQTITKRR